MLCPLLQHLYDVFSAPADQISLLPYICNCKLQFKDKGQSFKSCSKTPYLWHFQAYFSKAVEVRKLTLDKFWIGTLKFLVFGVFFLFCRFSCLWQIEPEKKSESWINLKLVIISCLLQDNDKMMTEVFF